jgi:FAD/FMN-containing dehydrogenase
VIDISRLNGVKVVDASSPLVRIGAGALWEDVARVLAPYGLAISSGDDGGVGVGGLATAGGIGLLTRARGLTIDNVRAVELVLADGTFVRADARQHSDLFWAMRGAGANFGVATAFEIEATPIRDVAASVTLFDATDTAIFIQRWATAVEQAPRQVTSFLTLVPGEAGPMAQAIAALDAYWERLGAYLDGVYVSFESRISDQLLRDAFPGATLDRLCSLKAKYDPHQVFRDNFPIPPGQ